MHLGHFALTAGLLPALLRAPAARVVTVSAIAATWRSGRLTDLMSETGYRPMGAYAKSKRANVVFTLELARRLADTPVTAVSVHPGAAITDLQRHTGGPLGRAFTTVAEHLLMGSPEGAARPSLYAATAPGVASGAFLGPAGRDQTSGTPRTVALPRGADDPAEGRLLWEESERLTGARFTP
ncbi:MULTISPECIES: SDR family NAD(P)-dependent oxidoreductase [unclassified Nocardiopsis]|uniref:SDR family NAD(P)-dependent oxidoreductase n=1 Tax=Nocardiopsis TaxID=2013 RepID=UPI00387A959E